MEQCTYPIGVYIGILILTQNSEKDSSRCKDCILFYFRINEQLNENNVSF